MSTKTISNLDRTKRGGSRPDQLRRVRLQNFLSYGSDSVDFEFGSLNILVGPNGAGKTNLIEAIRILRSAISNFGTPMLDSGGVGAYVWRGDEGGENALIGAEFAIRQVVADTVHDVSFGSQSGQVALVHEFIGPAEGIETDHPEIAFLRMPGGSAKLSRRDPEAEGSEKEFQARVLTAGRLRPNESGIEKRQDPEVFPILSDIARFYEAIAIYGEWTIGRGTAARKPVLAGTRSDTLLEDASNLAFVLAELRSTKALVSLKKALRRLKATYEDFSIRPVGGQFQLFIEEEGILGGINAMRLSDGTLRFLALAAILLHPKPPTLVIIDEPEIGMHPDLIEAIGEMIIEAASRTQLIIATHSPDLLTYIRGSIDRIYAFQAGPEGTSVRGFSRDQLDHYLSDEPLGDLWRQGDFGGNRF